MGNSLRAFLVVLVIIFVGVLGTVLVVGGNNRGDSGVNSLLNEKVSDYADEADSKAVWTLEGKIVGDNERNAVRITVTPFERKAELLNGYNQKVVDTLKFKNNQKAYKTFLLALDELKYGVEQKSEVESEQGVCPFGRTYIYEMFDGQDERVRLWSTTCRNAKGSFGGDDNSVKKLFEAQITDYRELIKNVRF